MTLSASPSPFPIRPSSTAILAITNSGTTGYCFRLASKYKNELNYSQKHGFVSAGSKQLITVASRSHLTPGLRIQLYAVAVEKSLGVPDDDMIKAIIDGSKHLKTPSINLKINVINTSVHNAEEQLLNLPPTHIQKGSSATLSTANDSDVSLFDNYVAHAQKSSYSLTNNTDTLYSSDHTCTSLIDSQLCESSVRRSTQVNSQLIDQLDIDMGQLKLQLQTLESKIDSILETVPLAPVSTSTSTKLNASQTLEFSEIDMNALVSAVTQRLTAELKSHCSIPIHSDIEAASCCDNVQDDTVAQKLSINEVSNPTERSDNDNDNNDAYLNKERVQTHEKEREQVSVNIHDTDVDGIIYREQSGQLTENNEMIMNNNENISGVPSGKEGEATGVRIGNSVLGQMSTPEVLRPSSKASKGKQLQNALGNIFILSVIFFIAVCTKLLKRMIQSKKGT